MRNFRTGWSLIYCCDPILATGLTVLGDGGFSLCRLLLPDFIGNLPPQAIFSTLDDLFNPGLFLQSTSCSMAVILLYLLVYPGNGLGGYLAWLRLDGRVGQIGSR